MFYQFVQDVTQLSTCYKFSIHRHKIKFHWLKCSSKLAACTILHIPTQEQWRIYHENKIAAVKMKRNKRKSNICNQIRQICLRTLLRRIICHQGALDSILGASKDEILFFQQFFWIRIFI